MSFEREGLPQRAYAGQLPQAQRLHVPREDRRRLRRAALHLRRAGGARQPPGLAPEGFRAREGRQGRVPLPQHAAHARRPLRRAGRRPRARRHKHPPRQGRGHLHRRALRGEDGLRGRRARGPARRRGRGCRAGPHRRHGRGGRPVRGLPGRGLARARPERAGGRGRDHLHQLHLGDDGPPEGRHVHAPRRVPERPGQRHRDRDGLRDQIPVDAPDVPLQRVDLSRGPSRPSRRRTCA